MPVISKFGILELGRSKKVVPNRVQKRIKKRQILPSSNRSSNQSLRLLWKKFLIMLFLVSEFKVIRWVWIYNTFIIICIEVGQNCSYLNLYI